jgi:hypothetical protein
MSAFGEKLTCWKTGTNSGGLCDSFVFGNTNKGRKTCFSHLSSPRQPAGANSHIALSISSAK